MKYVKLSAANRGRITGQGVTRLTVAWRGPLCEWVLFNTQQQVLLLEYASFLYCSISIFLFMLAEFLRFRVLYSKV